MAQLLEMVIGAMLGSAVASFLNVVADRVPAGRSIVAPPSACPDCGRRLTPLDMVPVASYVALRGRCRQCGSRIPMRVLGVEIVGALLGAFVAWRYGFTVEALLVGLAFAFLLVISIVDLEHKIIPDAVLIVALPVAFASAFFWPDGTRLPASLFGFQLNVVTDALVAGVFGFVLLLLIVIVTFGRGMGMGDVKYAFVMGIWLGVRLLPVGLYIAVILGGLIAIALWIAKLRGRKDLIPFGPYLAIGTGVAMVWGETLRTWYLDLIT
jgi:leader peptidase (prepilin peptidase)/N-methyltransferase